MADDAVSDAEALFRRIRKDWAVQMEAGKWRLTSEAFNDAGRKPSVDRECLRSTPHECRLEQSDAVAQLLAAEVRAIDSVVHNPGAPVQEQKPYKVDVVPRPIPPGNAEGLLPNPAHAQIETDPGEPPRSRFDKLKVALSRLASMRPLVVEPGTPLPGP